MGSWLAYIIGIFHDSPVEFRQKKFGVTSCLENNMCHGTPRSFDKQKKPLEEC